MSVAASIDFFEPIHDALQVNYFGVVRILDLAHECKRLQVMSHVSTCYGNSYMPDKTRIYEEIYPWKLDYEEFLAKVQAMNPQEAAEKLPELLATPNDGSYPNTYCVTKNMAEQHLKRYQGDVKIVINRPTMIIMNLYEPFPGWVDTVSAAGCVAFPVLLGLSNYFQGVNDVTMDPIPADVCSNSLLMQTVASAKDLIPKLAVFACSSSAVNPCGL